MVLWSLFLWEWSSSRVLLPVLFTGEAIDLKVSGMCGEKTTLLFHRKFHHLGFYASVHKCIESISLIISFCWTSVPTLIPVDHHQFEQDLILTLLPKVTQQTPLQQPQPNSDCKMIKTVMQEISTTVVVVHTARILLDTLSPLWIWHIYINAGLLAKTSLNKTMLTALLP